MWRLGRLTRRGSVVALLITGGILLVVLDLTSIRNSTTSLRHEIITHSRHQPRERPMLPVFSIRLFEKILQGSNFSNKTSSLNISQTDEIEAPLWRRLIMEVPDRRLFSGESRVLENVLLAMRRQKIARIQGNRHGTEFKLLLTLKDGTQVIAKPQRLPTDVDAPANMSKNDFFERFQSEVAAFHLNRLLGFNNVPPAVSRRVDLETELKPLVTNDIIKLYTDPDGNVCFTGSCRRRCNSSYPICGQGRLLNMSFALYIPQNVSNKTPFDTVYTLTYYPRTYLSANVCPNVNKTAAGYNSSFSILDIIDVNVFDYIQGNLDRHHIEEFHFDHKRDAIVLFDNGRGFARAQQDDLILLYALAKCCKIRKRTLDKLLRAYQLPGGLGAALGDSLQTEDILGMLTDAHLMAVNRRLVKVLETVHQCVGYAGERSTAVIIDDGY